MLKSTNLNLLNFFRNYSFEIVILARVNLFIKYFFKSYKLSTGRLSSEVWDSEKPVYAVSKLSKAKKRPRINDSIYSALHGPSANNSKLLWYEKEVNGVVEKTFITRNNLQKSTQPLYVYHGKKSIHIWSFFF